MEIEGHVDAVAGTAVIAHELPDGQINLSDQYAFATAVERPSHRAHDVLHLWLIFGIGLQLRVMPGLVRTELRIRLVVAEQGILD